MARQPRFQYPGALYHVMARGNGGEAVFVTDDDRKAFLHRLVKWGQVLHFNKIVDADPVSYFDEPCQECCATSIPERFTI